MGVSFELVREPPVCRWCRRPVASRQWWLPRPFCNHWHQVKYRMVSFVARILDFLC
ncbi:hypothetical protein ACWCWD_03780 [Streptomyces sp. NPDC001493]